ncbi:MAG: shikimate kinase [Pseudomonadota bacterium]
MTDPATTASLKRPIILIGLMGAGKTSVGRRLASRIGAQFVDSDAEIEAAAGMTIPEIFQVHGEPHFRAGERKVISRLLDGPPRVVATGGGAFMAPETREAALQVGTVVWLDADLDTLFARVSRKPGRPLLAQDDPKAVLAALMDDRYPIYARAHVRVRSTPQASHDEMAAAILEAVAAFDVTRAAADRTFQS